METQNQPETAPASQSIAELKERTEIALVSVASQAVAMTRTDTLSVGVCQGELIRRSISYLRARADYADALGCPVMAANCRAEADKLEGGNK